MPPPSQAMNQQSFRKILYRNISMPLVLAFVSSCTFVGIIFYLIQTTKMVDHTSQVISRGYQIEKLVVDAETGLRGYVLTYESSFLQPYVSATTALPGALESLKVFVADNPAQVGRMSALEEAFQRWQAFAKEVLKTSNTDKKKATALMILGRGKAITDQIRNLATQFIETEEGLRSLRIKTVGESIKIVIVIIVVFSLLVGVIIALVGRKQLLGLSRTYEKSLQTQMEQNAKLEEKQWIDVGRTELSQKMLGELKLLDLSDVVLKYLANYLGAEVGVLYVADEQGVFETKATYAISDIQSLQKQTFAYGEALLGQVAQENKIRTLNQLPEDYMKVQTSLGELKPRQVVMIPFLSDSKSNAVAELGFVEPLNGKAHLFLEEASGSVSVAVKSAIYREKLERLYRDVQNQAEELQSQQEELRVNNEELEEQTKLLRDAQTRLESQHAELEQTNCQLEEQTEILEKQKESLGEQNERLMAARQQLENKALELSRASQYKSEFLANMSHELRTPLNSSLILAKLLADNKEKNLSPKQVEFANQIISSGNDLLVLINDVLDLAKVESGKLDIHPEYIEVSKLLGGIEKVFMPIAKDRHLEFAVTIADDVPKQVFTDRLRVEQILKNLLSNAFKFTHKGQVQLTVRNVDAENIEIVVTDTGIGIPREQQQVIFEAFRQADGTDSRKYSGTGLGLSISRDLARLLGAAIRVHSQVGEGSQFVLILPKSYLEKSVHPMAAVSIPENLFLTDFDHKIIPNRQALEKDRKLVPTLFADDRENLTDTDRLVLVVEDDERFAKIIFDLAHESKYKVLVSGSADDAMDLIQAFNFSAILLDMNLPDHSGLYVLDHIKQNPGTRHIPVHVMSGFDFSQQALHMGAFSYMLKPVKREELKEAFIRIQNKIDQGLKHVLIIEDDLIQRKAITSLIEDAQVKATAVGLGKEGLEKLKTETFDCVIMDLSLPDMSGFDLLEQMATHEDSSHPPVIVYTGRDLSRSEEERLRKHSQSLIIKGASSPERLLNEVTLFLHKVESTLEPARQQMLELLRSREKVFEKRTILLVDDDMRNVFALTSALEHKGAQVVIARDGKEALEKLNYEPKIDMVLMDIMMPVMNGYEAMREIRKLPQFGKLPIIALTAKAMKDDRELCLKAGANDYLAKPVDIEKLVSLIRIWMAYGEGKGNSDGAVLGF